MNLNKAKMNHCQIIADGFPRLHFSQCVLSLFHSLHTRHCSLKHDWSMAYYLDYKRNSYADICLFSQPNSQVRHYLTVFAFPMSLLKSSFAHFTLESSKTTHSCNYWGTDIKVLLIKLCACRVSHFYISSFKSFSLKSDTQVLGIGNTII